MGDRRADDYGPAMRSNHLLLSLSALLAAPAAAAPLDGVKTILLHSRDGAAIPIGTVRFSPAGARTAFVLSIDPKRTTVFFLSMREFRCVEGAEVMCHVPYPYPTGGTIAAGDLAWLEHSLLFLTKSRREFGARLENGLYFPLRVTPRGLEGRPQRIDLNLIAAPPEGPTPPFASVERRDEPAGARWIERITIEDGTE